MNKESAAPKPTSTPHTPDTPEPKHEIHDFPNWIPTDGCGCWKCTEAREKPTPHTVPLEWMREAAKTIDGMYTDKSLCLEIEVMAAIIARHSPGWVKIEEGKPETTLRDVIPDAVWKQYDDAVEKAYSAGALKKLVAMEAKIGRMFIEKALPAPPTEGDRK